MIISAQGTYYLTYLFTLFPIIYKSTDEHLNCPKYSTLKRGVNCPQFVTNCPMEKA